MREWPPLWLALALIAVWMTPGDWGVSWLGWLLIALGALLMLGAVFEMSRARTTVIPHRQPVALVTSGVFRISRNPIYLGDALIILGASVASGSLVGLLLVPVFGVIIQRRFIIAEEARLERTFGAQFRNYRDRTPRWLGPI